MLHLPASFHVEISKAFGVYKEGASDKENVQALLDKITSLQKSIDAPRCLKGYIKEEPSMDYLIDVIKRTTGHITCNPRPLNEELMKAAYELAMKERAEHVKMLNVYFMYKY